MCSKSGLPLGFILLLLKYASIKDNAYGAAPALFGIAMRVYIAAYSNLLIAAQLPSDTSV
jgi:hypothetical protein